MPKPPSWNSIRSGAAAFASRWSGEARESAEAQTFCKEFFAIFGIDRRRVATFEARAARATTGRRGRVDLLWPGTLLVEHKSPDRDLDSAEAQAMDYLDSLRPEELPRLVVVSDFQHLRDRDLERDDDAPATFELTDLPLQIDRFGILAGYNRRDFGAAQEEAANVKAAQQMGRLYAA